MTTAADGGAPAEEEDTTGILRASIPSWQLRRGNMAADGDRLDFVYVQPLSGSRDAASLLQPVVETAFDRQAPAEIRVIRPVPRLPEAGVAFDILQMFEGTVREIDAPNQEFAAELRDLTRRRKVEEEEAVLPLEDVPPGDRPLVVPGAVFRWTIGYEDRPGGQRDRVSRIRFLRCGGWRSAEVKEIFEAAESKLREAVGADRENSGG